MGISMHAQGEAAAGMLVVGVKMSMMSLYCWSFWPAAMPERMSVVVDSAPIRPSSDPSTRAIRSTCAAVPLLHHTLSTAR